MSKKKKKHVEGIESKPGIIEVPAACQRMHLGEIFLILVIGMAVIIISTLIYDAAVNPFEMERAAYVEKLIKMNRYGECIILWEKPQNPAKGIFFIKAQYPTSRLWKVSSRDEIPMSWYADRNFKLKIRYWIYRNEINVISMRKLD